MSATSPKFYALISTRFISVPYSCCTIASLKQGSYETKNGRRFQRGKKNLLVGTTYQSSTVGKFSFWIRGGVVMTGLLVFLQFPPFPSQRRLSTPNIFGGARWEVHCRSIHQFQPVAIANGPGDRGRRRVIPARGFFLCF